MKELSGVACNGRRGEDWSHDGEVMKLAGLKEEGVEPVGLEEQLVFVFVLGSA